MNIEKLLPGIRKNIPLKDYTTFKIGGKAQYFFEAKTKEDIIKAIAMARQLKLPFFVLGAGSNILVNDKGFEGLVVKVENNGIKINNNKIKVAAGVMLGQVINFATKNNLTGMEWAVGIPGTVGGAIWGNAGAFKKSMADIVSSVEVLDVKKIITNYKPSDCKFNYRKSVFKKNNNLIILSAGINLKKSNKKDINRKIKEYSAYRAALQPLNFPSAGSVFKNPSFAKVSKNKTRKNFSEELEQFKENKIIPAAWLIEKCGLKGERIGGAKISEKHANFIVNLENGTSKDVKKLIKLVKNRVKKQFIVVLEEEIQFL